MATGKRRIELDNGLILLEEKVKSKKAVLQVGIKVGSVNEDEKLNGGSHFNEHMLFKSNKGRKAEQITKEMESMGMYVNAFTTETYTTTYNKAFPSDIPRLIDIIYGMYTNFSYDKKEFEKERSVILTEIGMYDEDNFMYTLERLFKPTLFHNHPLGKSIAGPTSSMASVTKKQLEDFKKKFYIPNNTVIAIAGNFDGKAFEKKIKETFGKLKSGKLEEVSLDDTIAIGKKEKIEAKNEISQSYLALGYRIEGCESPDVHKLRMLNGILSGGMSSRLFQELREKRGIGYSVGAFAETWHGIGYFAAYIAGFDPARFDEAVEAIRGQLNGLKKNLVTEEELKRAKKIMLSSFYDSMESLEKRANSLLEAEMLKLPYDPRKVDKFVKNAKREDILEMANKYFTGDYILAALVPNSFKK